MCTAIAVLRRRTATRRKPRLASWLDAGGDSAIVSGIVDELRDRSSTFRFKWDIYRLLFARMSDDPSGGEPDAYDYNTKLTVSPLNVR